MLVRRLIAAALAACLLLAGCAGSAQSDTPDVTEPELSAQSASSAAAPEEAEQHEYGLAYSAEDGWNPYTSRSQENRIVFALLYEGLFEVSPEFEAVPVLCESFTVSDDEKTYVFTLRADARFSDGTALTAADVAASYALAETSDYYAGRFQHIESYTASSAKTVTVTLDTACGSLPLLLDIPIVRSGTGSLPQPTGSGPYVLKSAPVRLESTSSWWQEKELPMGGQTVSLLATTSETEVRDAFELREISLVCTDPNAGTACVYHSDYELWICPTTVMVYLGFNQKSDLFSSALVRAGVTHLIDRDSIVTEEFGGFAASAALPASPLAACYDRALAAQYAYDPDAFTASVPSEEGTLLVNAGDRARVRAAERIARAMNEAGFAITVKSVSAEEYQTALETGAYDCYLGEIRLTTDFSLEAFLRPDGAAAYGIGGDETALTLNDKLLENAGNAYDLHRQVMEDGLLCPILFKSYAVYCARGAFSNLTAAPYNVFFAAPEPDEEAS